MNCDQAKEKISLYIDNELSKEEKIEFESHIKECKKCYDEYLSLLEVVNSVNNMEELALPSEFKNELRNKLEESLIIEKKDKGRWRGKWTSLAAMLLVGVFLTSFLTGPYSPFGNNSSMEERAGDGEGISYNSEISADQRSGSPSTAELEDEAKDMDLEEDNVAIEESGQNDVVDRQEKIIYSANVTLQVNNFERVYEDILQYTNGIGGFIQNSYTYNPEYNRTMDNNQTTKEGHISIRVPNDRFEEAIDKIEDMGNVIDHQRSGENITSQYRDIETEVNNLEIQEERILEIMKKAEEVEDLIMIEKELNRIRTQINQRKTTIKNWDQLVDFSTIEISLREEKFSTSTIEGNPFQEIGLKIQKGFIQSINLIVEGLAKFIVLLSRAIPFILILILLYIIYRKWFRNKIKDKIEKNKINK